MKLHFAVLIQVQHDSNLKGRGSKKPVSKIRLERPLFHLLVTSCTMTRPFALMTNSIFFLKGNQKNNIKLLLTSSQGINFKINSKNNIYRNAVLFLKNVHKMYVYVYVYVCVRARAWLQTCIKNQTKIALFLQEDG